MVSPSPNHPPTPVARPVIWAVGGGKGGAGKSVISSSLGVMLARRGKTCVLLDADLGGANLHTMLGMPGPRLTLSDFLRRKVAKLDEILVETPFPRLRLASGSRALMEMANPKHAQKEKILRHVQGLDADHVILDLGAGSSINVIDFFLAATQKLTVVMPEPTAVENAYHFLKAAYFRRLKRATHLPGVRPALDRVLDRKGEEAIQSAKGLLEAVKRNDPEAGQLLAEEACKFNPLILINRASSEIDQRLGSDMKTACRTYFDSEVDYLGTLPDDELVRAAVQSRRPVVEAFPTCSFSMAMNMIIDRLTADEARDEG